MRVSSTDEASARYSRWRLTASWMNRLMIGARIARTIATTKIDGLDPVAAAVAVATAGRTAAPEREAQEEVGQDRDRADHDADDQREPDVEVAHVRQLVADDALELLAIELLEEAGRDRDRRVLRIAAGREGVRRGVVDDVDRRHRHVGRDRQLAHDVHELRRGGLVDLAARR